MAATDMPQPGDGAFLARPPQPGDGAYLMSSQQSAGQRRQGERRRNNASANGNAGNRTPRRNGGGNATPSTGDSSSIQGSLENLRSTDGNGSASAGPSQPSGSKQGRNRRNNNGNGDARRRNDASKAHGDGTASGARTPKFQPNPSAPAFEPGQAIDFSQSTTAQTANAGPSQERRRKGTRKPKSDDSVAKQKEAKARDSNKSRAESPAPKVSSRRAAFEKGTKLTSNDREPRPRRQNNVQQQPSLPEADDLNSRLTRGLAKKPYIECPIVS